MRISQLALAAAAAFAILAGAHGARAQDFDEHRHEWREHRDDGDERDRWRDERRDEWRQHGWRERQERQERAEAWREQYGYGGPPVIYGPAPGAYYAPPPPPYGY